MINCVKIFSLFFICFFVLPVSADNFVWTWFDDNFYSIQDDLNGLPQGMLTAISDISYQYDLGTKQLIMNQKEWISDGHDGEYSIDTAAYYILNLSDFAETLYFEPNVDDILDSFRHQAENDIADAGQNLISMLNLNNVDNEKLNVLNQQVLDNVFSDNQISPEVVYSVLNHDMVIGDTSAFANSTTKNISNGTQNNATTLSEAVANIDATLGTIHGLNDKSGTAAKGNLATGTTVEQHLVALDDAIGNRSQISGRYLVTGGAVSTNLQSLNNGLETERQSRIEGDALTLRAAQSYTDNRIEKLNKDLSAGIASAVALSSVASYGVKEGKMSFNGGYGYYNGQSAGAFGVALGLKDNWSVNAGAGVSGSNVAFRAGTSYEITLW